VERKRRVRITVLSQPREQTVSQRFPMSFYGQADYKLKMVRNRERKIKSRGRKLKEKKPDCEKQMKRNRETWGGLGEVCDFSCRGGPGQLPGICGDWDEWRC